MKAMIAYSPPVEKDENDVKPRPISFRDDLWENNKNFETKVDVHLASPSSNE